MRGALVALSAAMGSTCAVGRLRAAGHPLGRAPRLHARPLAMIGGPEDVVVDGARGGGDGGGSGAGSSSGSEGEQRALLADAPLEPSGWRQRALLPALLAVYLHNQWSRSMLYYLIDFGERPNGASPESAARELMNVELGFGSETYGALASLPFTFLFAPVSLLAGGAADKSNRARLTWLSLLGWSAATFWQGSASSAGEVAASRAMQGFAQAFTTPAAFTLLADVTPQARRGTANSVYSTGVYVGGGLAALSILLDRALGWRGALHFAALTGALLAAGAALTLEDPREAPRAAGSATPPAAADAAAAQPGGVLGGARALAGAQAAALGRTAAAVAERPAVQLLLASCALRFCAGFSIAVWVGPWGREAFPERQADFALAKAVISALGGSFSVRARAPFLERDRAAPERAPPPRLSPFARPSPCGARGRALPPACRRRPTLTSRRARARCPAARRGARRRSRAARSRTGLVSGTARAGCGCRSAARSRRRSAGRPCWTRARSSGPWPSCCCSTSPRSAGLARLWPHCRRSCPARCRAARRGSSRR